MSERSEGRVLLKVLFVLLILCVVSFVSWLVLLGVSGFQHEKLANKEAVLRDISVSIINGAFWQPGWVENPLGMGNSEYGKLLDQLAGDLSGNEVPCWIEWVETAETARGNAVLRKSFPRIYLSPSYAKEELEEMLREVKRFNDLSERAERKFIIGYTDSTLDLKKVNSALAVIVAQEGKWDHEFVLFNSWKIPKEWGSSSIKIKAAGPGDYLQRAEVPTLVINVNAEIEVIKHKISAFMEEA